MDNVQPYLRCQGWEHELTLVDHLNISIDHMLSICPTSDSSPKYRICRTRFCSWCWHLWAFVRHKARILGLVAAVIQHMTQKNAHQFSNSKKKTRNIWLLWTKQYSIIHILFSWVSKYIFTRPSKIYCTIFLASSSLFPTLLKLL